MQAPSHTSADDCSCNITCHNVGVPQYRAALGQFVRHPGCQSSAHSDFFIFFQLSLGYLQLQRCCAAADIMAAVAFEETSGNLNLVYRSDGPVSLVEREELKVILMSICNNGTLCWSRCMSSRKRAPLPLPLLQCCCQSPAPASQLPQDALHNARNMGTESPHPQCTGVILCLNLHDSVCF